MTSSSRISPTLRLPNTTRRPLLAQALGLAAARGRDARRRRRRLDVALLAAVVGHVAQALLEFLDPLPQRRPDLGDTSRAEDEHENEEQNQDVAERQVTEHGRLVS